DEGQLCGQHWTARGKHVASVTNAMPSDPADGGPQRLDETPAVVSLGPRGASAIADPSPVRPARKNRSDGFLREQLFFGDVAAITLAWGLPMLFQSKLRSDQS